MAHRPLSLQYRPQTFADLVGQQDIIKPLIHSLDAHKPHPAYLLTGIRGIGKTTIARIIAKSLNCEHGISGNPCNECGSCQSIREGRHPDVFEIDAASRTRVEDTREILDNIPYRPAESRFKVFIIDEVHMLSNHSFNALLKTLEEPPEHVRFILATTDPQKIPATVVSRCLQYHLQRIAPTLIVEHLANVLNQEGIEFEQNALQEIALASECSMRDALSILEQAIYFSESKVTHETVLSMLGLTDRQTIQQLLLTIADKDFAKSLGVVEALFKQGAQLGKVIEQLIEAIHSLSIFKVAPELIDTAYSALAERFTHDALQMMYQGALLAKRDIDLSPSEKAALEMLMLRLIHFTPVAAPEVVPSAKATAPKPTKTEVPIQPPIEQAIPQSKPDEVAKKSAETITQTAATPRSAPEPSVAPSALEVAPASSDDSWLSVVNKLKLSGMAFEIINHAILKDKTESHINLIIDPKYQSMINEGMIDRIQKALSEVYAQSLKLSIDYQNPGATKTPYEIKQAQAKAELDANIATLEQDPGIQLIKEELGASIAPETVQHKSETLNQED